MKPVLLLIAASAHCIGDVDPHVFQCPAGETCSPATPDGLEINGSPIDNTTAIGPYWPLPTAIGGTQELTLDDGSAFALPFSVDDQGGAGVRYVGASGNVITIEGAGSGSNFLRIVDPATGDLYDRALLYGAAIDAIALVPATEDQIPEGMPWVFATADVTFAVALTGNVDGQLARLVDTSLAVTSTPAPTPLAWDEYTLGSVTAGDYEITATTGSGTLADLTATAVDGADAITLIDSKVYLNYSVFCFAATNAGRFVTGLTWTFTANGAPLTMTGGLEGALGNCAYADGTDAIQHYVTPTLTIVASAGGQTTSATVTITP